jgi:hypothetical protein
MNRYGLFCLLFGALAWGQAAKPNPAPASQQPSMPGTNAQPAAPAPEAKEVPPDTPVITIDGLCDHPPADKSAPCKTVITRADFEKIVDAVQPNMPPRVRRQFASRYTSALVMAKKGEEAGLDKTTSYDEHMKLARIQVLAQEENKAISDKAGQVPDKDIEDYYKANLSKFEEADMDRVYIPKNQQPPESDKDKKVTEDEEKKRTEESEKAMKAEADKLRARAATGEDFAKLQEEAYKVAGITTGAPNTAMGKMRRSMLPPAQLAVFDLKPGTVSDVIADQNGYFIYKLKSKDTLPIDQVKEEIKGTLRSQRMQDEMQAVQKSATTTYDDAYFGPEGPSRPMPGPGMPPPIRPAPTQPGPK